MIGVGGMDIGPRERELMNQVLDSGQITGGPILTKFENEFARRHERNHGIMVNSGTSALQIALAALMEHDDWDVGDEVIVPALTFVASSNMILEVGLTPRFVDVEPDTYNIDPQKIEDAINPRTKAIMVVHLFGLPCDMELVLRIARQYNLRVIEDSCEAMGVTYEGHPVGSFGDIACFSTYAAHIISTGVGGLALCDNPQLYAIMRSLANHGRDPNFLGYSDSRSVNPAKYNGGSTLSGIIDRRFRFPRFGWSHRPTQMEAALGLGQLERLDEIISKRRANAAFLSRNIESHIQRPTIPKDRGHAFMMYPIVLPDSIDRKAVMLDIELQGVETRPFFNVLRQPCYAKNGWTDRDVPVSKRLSNQGFYVGCHQNLSDTDLYAIVQAVDIAFAKNQVAA